MVGKFPVCVLYIDITPGLVDVNVHPTKMEVRFENDKKIYNAVYWAVKEALTDTRHVPEIDSSSVFSLSKEDKKEIRDSICEQSELPITKTFNHEDKSTADKVKEDILSAVMNNAKGYVLPHLRPDPTPSFRNEHEYVAKPEHVAKPEYAKPPVEEKAPSVCETVKEEPVVTRSEPEIVEEFIPGRDFTLIGQVFNTYIIAQSGDDMLLIDQHAAHERIWFEDLMESHKNGNISHQQLMIPVSVTLDGADFNTVSSNIGFFEEVGFEIDIFGENEILVRGVPMESDDETIRETLGEIIVILSNNAVVPKHELYEKTLHTVACKKAIKGGRPLTEDEMEHLVCQVMKLESINTCPHGRPICVRMSKKSMEKQFKRIV
jgi:DNA mismatch repair protein MutL